MAIIDDVRLIISKSLKIPLDQLASDAHLDQLGAESLDVIEIVFELEEKFDIAIPFSADEGTIRANGDDADVPFSTIADIANMVARLVAEKTSSARTDGKGGR